MHVETIAADAATKARARFTIAARPLSDAVKLLSGKVTERRNQIPILSALLIDVSPCGRVTITATDLDIWATVTLAADPSGEIEPGALCVNADALAKLLAKVAKNSGLVRIEAQAPEVSPFDSSTRNKPASPRVTLKAGRNEYKVPSLPRDDFPMHKAVDLDCVGLIDRAQFLGDLKALSPAVSNDETRPYLNGYAMQVRELGGAARFVTVSANGPNMVAASRPIRAGLEGWQDAILPRKAGAVLLAADKVAGDCKGITLSRFGGMMAAEFGAVRIVSGLIDGDFPDWQNAFGAACTPTDETETALFPEMMPGRPLAAMEGLVKAAPTAIQWAETERAFIGESAADTGLAWCCMKLISHDEPRKGFRYSDGVSRDYARDYLKALADAQGLPGQDTFNAACVPFNKSPEFRGSARALFCLATDGGRVLGLTVGGAVYHSGRWETVQDWEALCERQVWIEPREEAIEGSYSVLMPANGPAIEPDYSVTVEGDRRYPVAVNAGSTAIHLSADQVRALIGDSVWTVLEFPGADGKPRYVSQWLWDDGATRLLIVGKDGRCPKAGAVRQYVTRAEVEAALAGEIPAPVMIEAPAPIPAEAITVAPEAISAEIGNTLAAPETAPVCVAATPPATHAAETVEAEPVAAPVAAEPVMQDHGDPIAARAARVAIKQGHDESDSEYLARIELIEAAAAEIARAKTPAPLPDACPIAAVRARLAEIEALLATLPAQSARPKRTPAHERAIRRAWAERKARREAQQHTRDAAHWCNHWHKEYKRAVAVEADTRKLASQMSEESAKRRAAAEDRAKLAESIAEDHLRMREDLQRVLVGTERRLAAAEAENAQLWAEIETLTAPVPALAA